MRRPFPHLLAAMLAVPFALAACADRNPAALPDLPSPVVPPSAVAMLTCTVSVADASMACRSPEAAVPSGVSGAIIGGQGAYVRLASSNVSYDGTSAFRMDVTLENLTAQALGTADGVTPSPEGVRVFFSSPPVATDGTGAVEVANADGEGFFTAAAQKYFRYEGILAPGDTSAAKEWRFSVPSAVSTFTFGVYVATPVRAEAGWLSMSPLGPSLPVGDTMRITATARNLAGGAANAEAVAWTTSNPSVATVDAQGLVTGVGPGTATVTATSGGRTGAVEVRVYGPGDGLIATVHGLEVLGGTVVADGADSVVFRSSYSGPPGLPLFMQVVLRDPAGNVRTCQINNPTLTDTGMEWRCRMVLGPGSYGGVWRVQGMTMANRSLTHEALLAAGAPAYVNVRSPSEDRMAPTLDSLSIYPDTVTLNEDQLYLTLVATDEVVGVDGAEVWISSPGNPRLKVIPRSSSWRGDGQVALYFQETIPAFYQGGTFSLDSVRVSDRNGNRRALSKAQLVAAGLEAEFTVISNAPDTIPPTITGFTFSPDTIAGNGADPVTVTLSASEPTDQSGVWFLDMEFEKVSDFTQRRRCLLNGSTRVFTRTMTCSRTFNAADVGAWRVRYIRAIDFQNNTRELNTQQMQAAGYATSLTVTGATPDADGPVITAFSFSPQTVAGNGVDSVAVTLTTSEPADGSGTWYMDVVFERVSDTSQFRRCQHQDPGALRELTLTCSQAFTAGDAGEWRVRYVRGIDVMYNSRILRTADLQAAGYPTALTVTAP